MAGMCHSIGTEGVQETMGGDVRRRCGEADEWDPLSSPANHGGRCGGGTERFWTTPRCQLESHLSGSRWSVWNSTKSYPPLPPG